MLNQDCASLCKGSPLLTVDGVLVYPVSFEEHEHAHGAANRDNNMRAAVIHVVADAAVSVLVIIGLLVARAFGPPLSLRSHEEPGP